MKRREWMKAIGAAGAAAAWPRRANAGISSQTQGSTIVDTDIIRLKLRHTWTTTMSSSAYRDTLHVRFHRDGITGIGEGAPIIRYGENTEEARRAVESIRDLLVPADPWKFMRLQADISHRLAGQYAAKSAIDIAIMDWIGKKLGIPLYRYFGLDPADAPVTSFSIGIDTPEMTRQKVQEAESYPVLKVKVGLDSDEATLDAIRSVTKKPLRVDANEGWKSKEEAVRKINWLETMGVELIEQPMPAAMLDDIRWVRSRVHIPIIADEACLRSTDIPKLAGCFDGVNIKLDKSGGILEANRMIQIARSLGMKIMIGCMVSSSVSITAAAHLSPLADYADLDGNLLVSNDPYEGARVQSGCLILPDGPGLGLRPAPAS